MAEASDLGWKPGEVKESVTLDGERFDYARLERSSDGDEIISFRYVSASGRSLIVFND